MKITELDSPQNAVICASCGDTVFFDYDKETKEKCPSCGNSIYGEGDDYAKVYSISSKKKSHRMI